MNIEMGVVIYIYLKDPQIILIPNIYIYIYGFIGKIP